MWSATQLRVLDEAADEIDVPTRNDHHVERGALD
jgi:hypothetical protein